MWPLISRIAAIARFRAGPQDLPADPRLLGAVVAVDAVVNIVAMSFFTAAGQAAVVVLAALGLALMFSYIAVYLRGGVNRWLQTATALIGTDAIISLLSLPLSAAIARHVQPDGTSSADPLLSLAMLALLAWYWAIAGRVFRAAMDLPPLGGLAVALAYVLVTAGFAF